MSRRGKTGTGPLYAQIREVLLERVRTGRFAPGQLLPGEFELAAEFGVSQGTVRRALDALAREHIVVRRQGSGTYVSEPRPDEWLFRYFNIFTDDGQQVNPDSVGALATSGPAKPSERARLGLPAGARVIRIHRQRTHAGRVFIVETLVLPAELFPGLADRAKIPNGVYDVYQKDYGVLVGRGDERLTPVAAKGKVAQHLAVRTGTPLIRIDRVVYGIDDRAVEWRLSFCNLGGLHYRARLT